MTKVEYFGQIVNGGLEITNEKGLARDLKQFKDCEIVMIIKKRGKRSHPQNRYYWGVVIAEIRIRLRELGNEFDAETVHEFLKAKFNGEKIEIPGTGEQIEIGQTTTDMTVEDFSEYLERVIRFANETLEIIIPEAGTQTKMFSEHASTLIVSRSNDCLVIDKGE